MSLWFLPILLLGVALLTYGGVMYAFGKRRSVGLIFGTAGVLMGLSAPIGVLIGDGSATTPTTEASAPTAPSSALAFTYPTAGEALDAQDYLLEGTGPAGETLEISRNGEALGNLTVGANNTWSYYVQAPQTGEYDYEIRGSSGSANLKLSVQQGLTTASNAQCPCRLRIVTNERQTVSDATAVLFKDGTEIARGTAPFIFTNLEAGEYTFTLEAAGFKTFETGKASLPKNKNISAYLEPQR
jgi:hypothetical protein